MIDTAGGIEPLLPEPGDYTFPRVSPDGRRLAITVTESGRHGTLIYDDTTSTLVRLPADSGNYSPTWSPDGAFLVTGGSTGLHWTATATLDTVMPLLPGEQVRIPWSFTPDGSRLAYHELSPSTGFDLWAVPIHISDGTLSAGTPEPLVRTRAFETYPSFSHDGRWLAYTSGEQGRWDIYVRAYPDDGGPVVRVSNGGGRIPRWLPGGGQLLYRSDDHRLMVARYTVERGAFVVGDTALWTPAQLADTGVLSNFDVRPDGRVVGLVPPSDAPEQQGRNHATIVVDFGEEIRRRSAPGRR